MEKSQVVIEELMRAAVDAALKAAARSETGDKHAAGQVYAYHHVLEILKQQSDLIGLQFADRGLAEFDPDTLYQKQRLAA